MGYIIQLLAMQRDDHVPKELVITSIIGDRDEIPGKNKEVSEKSRNPTSSNRKDEHLEELKNGTSILEKNIEAKTKHLDKVERELKVSKLKMKYWCEYYEELVIELGEDLSAIEEDSKKAL